MNIGAVARRTNLPAKTIRYYEDIQLVVPARRANGYRDYGDRDIQVLRFLKRARSLGFTIEDCRGLLRLHPSNGQASGDPKMTALQWVNNIDRKIAELGSLKNAVIKIADTADTSMPIKYPILERLPVLDEEERQEN